METAQAMEGGGGEAGGIGLEGLATMATQQQQQQHPLEEEEEELQHYDSFGMDSEQQWKPMQSTKPTVRRACRLLNRSLRVGVSDGRSFVGRFYCLDKQGNILLYDAVEYRDAAKPLDHRKLGLILIPARWRTSCHFQCSLHEQLSLLSLDPEDGDLGPGDAADRA